MAGPKERKQPGPEQKCAICESRRQPGQVEIYQFRDEVDTYIFQLDAARAIADAGRRAVPLAPKSLLRLLGMNAFDEGHLGHVDPEKPGTATRRFGGLVLLDGIHRAVRCFAEGRRFFVRELSYEESLACLVQQQVSVRDAAAITRKLRQALEYFPAEAPLDAPIECSAEILEEVARLLTQQEAAKFNLRAVPVPQ
ncbi:MAG TPA: hypothetical protein VNV88_16440 [Candidatus Solibacter sp.]|jgi:hypothetical protein|nr:hypothetical protein [Candidatus Solibacter sp.]